jgi:hypothetical protein
MTITALPSAPQPTDTPQEFNAKGFALVAALALWTTQANALEANVSGLESSADASKVIAVQKALEAFNSAAASLASQNASSANASASETSNNQASSFSTAASNSMAQTITKALEALNSANLSTQRAQEAAGSAAAAAQIVFGNLIMHPNRIDQSLSIPDGQNAFFISPVEFGPNVTVMGLGNSTLRGV